MARVKVCPVSDCRHENSPGDLSCRECRSSLAGVPLTDPAPAAKSEERTGKSPAAPGGATSPGGGPEDAWRATLVFRWGSVVVTSREPVGIGRDPRFSPQVAGRIADNDYVSRRHAEVFMQEDGTTCLRHLSATNPTYVNGRKYTERGADVLLTEDDVIGFSRHLTATVRFG